MKGFRREFIIANFIIACAVLICDFVANSQESRKEFYFFKAKYFVAPNNQSKQK